MVLDFSHIYRTPNSTLFLGTPDTFLPYSPRREFKPSSPLLVVAPQSVLEFWDGEWQFWAEDPTVNVDLYSGPASARACVLEYEAWLNPSSTDGKAVSRVRGCRQVPG